MCEYCEIEKPIIDFSKSDIDKRSLKVNIGNGWSGGKGVFRVLSIDLNVNGNETNFCAEINYCPMCGRKLEK